MTHARGEEPMKVYVAYFEWGGGHVDILAVCASADLAKEAAEKHAKIEWPKKSAEWVSGEDYWLWGIDWLNGYTVKGYEVEGMEVMPDA